MNIFITGGSGFIGRNLVEHLSRRHNVLAPTHNELDLVDDKAVREYFKLHKFDVVIHSAVRPGHRNAKDPTSQLYNNTRMILNLTRESHSLKKLIVLSSGAVYDQTYNLSRIKEECFDMHVPTADYAFSKYVIARHIEKIENAVELRLFGIFGKYEDYSIRFISNAVCKTLFDLPITLKQNRMFDYIFIDDLMPVIDHFLRKSQGSGAYNVCADVPVELEFIAERVKKISGKDLPIIKASEGMGLEYSGDNGRLRTEISSWSLTPLDKAIESLLEWYRQNRETINREALLVDR